MDPNTTGSFIAQMRKQKGYTQKELAEKLAVTDKAISRWETGKGFPETTLLKPLGDALGVSVGELLAGKQLEETQLKEQTDRIILESLQYTRRMLATAGNILLYLVGLGLLLSPLFLVRPGFAWMWGIAFLAVAIGCSYIRTKGIRMKASKKTVYFGAMLLQIVALVLEILPLGAVLVFATGPEERIVEVYSYFSLVPWGYANFAPMATGLLTVAVVLLGARALLRFDRGAKGKKAAFLCSLFALLFSVVPLLLFGPMAMTACSYVISGLILLSACLQAVANRQD